MLSNWIAACLMAISTSAWKIDIRKEAWMDDHTIYLKSGEILEVLVDGFNGTGYSWMNNLEYAERNNLPTQGSHIDYIDEEDYFEDELYDYLDDPLDGFMPGHQKSAKVTFETHEGEDFTEVIRFAYERPWLMKGNFPATRQDFESGMFTRINVIGKANFAHDFRCDNYNLRVIPDNLAVQAGDLIRLVIIENPTTGYEWHTSIDS